MTTKTVQTVTVTQTKQSFQFHFSIDAEYGGETFKHSGDVTREGYTREEAKKALMFEICKHWWPRVGQLVEREVTIS